MAATILSSPRAIEVSVYVVRAFVRMRELAATHGDLAKRLAELEDKTEALAMNHETFSRNTRNQLEQVFDALRELMTPPEPPKRPIGYVTPEHKPRKISRARRIPPRGPHPFIVVHFPPRFADASTVSMNAIPFTPSSMVGKCAALSALLPPLRAARIACAISLYKVAKPSR